ncbi:MAG: 4Fe-4S binding protein [Candidatus Thorarchaeota archaeon]
MTDALEKEKTGVSIGEKPEITMDVVDGKLRLLWKTSLLTRTLDYQIDRCVGCTLCLYCPWDAITLGPVGETAAGRIEGAPLVNVDPDLCTFCGLCDSACIFGAFEASYQGEGAVNTYNRIEGIHSINEDKCAPCLLCAKVCPTGALDVDVQVDHKKDLVVYEKEESAEGTIKIHEDKCSYCGLCELLCPEAIKIIWSESAEPPEFKPAIAIRVNEDECDYCGLCAEICPDEAIDVECTSSSPRTIQKPKIEGKLHHNDDLCVKCGLCAIVCPYEALRVEKPFSGEVTFPLLEKCDPIGCHNCFNICPVKAIYPTGQADKIAVLDDHCLYCGACMNSCPYDVIAVTRDGYNVEELEKARKWERARKLFFDAVVGIDPPQSSLFERDIVLEAPHKKEVHDDDELDWNIPEAERKEIMKTISLLRKMFKENPKIKLQLEKGKADDVFEEFMNQKENLKL